MELYGLNQGRNYNKIQHGQLQQVNESQVNTKLLQETTMPNLGNVEGMENMSDGVSNVIVNQTLDELKTLEATFKTKMARYTDLQNTLQNDKLRSLNGTQPRFSLCPVGYNVKSDGMTCEDPANSKTCSLDEYAQGIPRCRFIGKCPSGYENVGNGSACRNVQRRKYCALVTQRTKSRMCNPDKTTNSDYTSCPDGYIPSKDRGGVWSNCKSKTDSNKICSLNEWARGVVRCRYVGKCPTGYDNIGDGSACQNGPDRCALYGNASLKRCSALSTDSIEQEIDSLNAELTQLAQEIHEKSAVLRNKDDVLNSKFAETRRDLLQKIEMLNTERNKIGEREGGIATLSQSLDDSRLQLSANNLKYVTLGLGAVGLAAFTMYYLRN